MKLRIKTHLIQRRILRRNRLYGLWSSQGPLASVGIKQYKLREFLRVLDKFRQNLFFKGFQRLSCHSIVILMYRFLYLKLISYFIRIRHSTSVKLYLWKDHLNWNPSLHSEIFRGGSQTFRFPSRDQLVWNLREFSRSADHQHTDQRLRTFFDNWLNVSDKKIKSFVHYINFLLYNL